MKLKLQVNYASIVTKGAFGPFGNLLVTPIGTDLGADKVSIRTTAEVATVAIEKIAKAKLAGQVLTCTAEISESTTSDGVTGVRQETYTNGQGIEVTQSALYLRFASTPVWVAQVGKDDLGNLADV